MTTLLLVLTISAQALYAEDWPMWRYDSYRSACSEEQLPKTLILQWNRQYSPREQVWDDPMNNDMMTYDKVFEPIIVGNKLFVNFNDSDKLVAFDLDSGKEVWRFYTDGPIRLAPAAYKENIYITSDDGHLYCVSAETGKQIWNFRGGPSTQKVIGNKRVISMWPARGGPVVRDGHVYCAAGIWPFMGVFIYALDAETGKVVWVNDQTGAHYNLQPHSGPGFGGVAPQGALVATKEVLVVPGGRSIPAAFNRQTGSLMYFDYAAFTKARGGGSFVAADEGRVLFHMEKRGVTHFDLMTGTNSKKVSGLNEPVLSGDMIYTSDGSSVRALNSDSKELWKVQADGSGDLIKAGNRLYAAGANDISVIELSGKKQGTVVQTIPVKGKALRLLAGNGKLAAVTSEGSILVFGDNAKAGSVIEDKKSPLPRSDNHKQTVEDILKSSAGYEGYALCFGVDDGKLLDELLNQSELHIVAVDPDKQKVDQLRQRYDKAGLYGKRISVHQGTPMDFKAPSFIANMIVVGKVQAKAYAQKGILSEIYRSVRPYGGVLWYPSSITTAMQDKTVAGGAMISRSGALEGSADWTHQYADIANTVKSNDKRVKLPLGILWFGGNSHVDVLPRHAYAPTELVAGGRLFIEGVDSLSARDVYTGRVMWRRQVKQMGTYGVYYTYPYDGDLLSSAYSEQRHYPGAKKRGSNYAITDDSVYLAVGNGCLVLDAATGKTKRTITIPDENGQKRNWGFIGVYRDILFAGAGFANYTKASLEDQAKSNFLNGPYKGKDATALDNLSASKGVIAFNRHTGERLWEVKANYSFYHNGIVVGNGRLYCLDRLPQFAEAQLLRRGKDITDKYRIAAFDIDSGKQVWQSTEHSLGLRLAFSEKHDILLMEGQGMRAFNGKSGDTVWENKRRPKPPVILHNDIIITKAPKDFSSPEAGGAFNIPDGTEVKLTNPLTGQKEPWQVSSSNCGYILGAENLLTFRSGSAGYYDLKNISGTGNFGGFKSGCSPSHVAANGVLNAPDYTRTCRCIYQNQTSMAMIHMPEVATWTQSQFAGKWSAYGAIKRMGINFAAPGDRMAENGTLWLEWPVVGGPSPSLEIKTDTTPVSTYTRHSSVSGPHPYAWVSASGIKNVGTITINLTTRQGMKSPADKKHEEEKERKRKGNSTTDSAVNGSEGTAEKADITQNTEGSYTVYLYFAEPENKQPGERVFDVSLQGKTVLEDLDIVKEAGGQWKSLVKEALHENQWVCGDAFSEGWGPSLKCNLRIWSAFWLALSA